MDLLWLILRFLPSTLLVDMDLSDKLRLLSCHHVGKAEKFITTLACAQIPALNSLPCIFKRGRIE